jgi:tetratricopeptide (TPR) repeat protein
VRESVGVLSVPALSLACALLVLGLSMPVAAQTAQPAAPPNASPTPAAGQAPAAAPAQPAALAAPPTQEQRDKAREAYARGQALFDAGKFAEAEAAFAEAYAAVPNPVVLLSTSECEVHLGKLDDAYVALQRYLQERPDAPDRAEVERKAADIVGLPATLVLSSEPSGAAVKLDGHDTGAKTPTEISTARGPHTIGLSLPGYEPASETVQARIGARHELHAVLKLLVAAKEEPPPPPPPPSLKVAPQTHEVPTTALWITSITGAAGLVTGTVLGFLVLAERSDYDAKPTEATAKRGERLALFTDVAFGMGAMALVTGAVLYFTADEAQASEPHEHAASFMLSPATSAHGAGLTARGRF